MPTIPLGNEKNSEPVHRKLDALARFQFWQPNAHMTTWVLVVDFDTDDWFLPLVEGFHIGGMPRPSWVIQKASNGHGQAGYVIHRVPTGPNSRWKPQTYARDVRQALTNALGGDQAFTNARCWNPWWSGWTRAKNPAADHLIWGPMEPRHLGELREAMVAAGCWNPRAPAGGIARSLVPVAEPDEGRNNWVFNQARVVYTGDVEDNVRALNDSLIRPLPESEVRSITRSIEKYRAIHGSRSGGGTMSSEQIERQRVLGAMGGSQNTDAQKAARARGPEAASAVRTAERIGRAAVIVHWHQQGLTRRQIMAKVGVSESTVKRALRAHRADSA